MVHADLAEDLLSEEAPEGCLVEVGAEEAVDRHGSPDHCVGELALGPDLLHDAGQELVVEQGDAHEDRDLALLHVVEHPRDDDAVAEDA